MERFLPQMSRGTNGHSRGNRQACSPSFDLLRFMSLIATLGLCLIDASFPLIRRPRPMCCLASLARTPYQLSGAPPTCVVVYVPLCVGEPYSLSLYLILIGAAGGGRRGRAGKERWRAQGGASKHAVVARGSAAAAAGSYAPTELGGTGNAIRAASHEHRDAARHRC